MKAALTGLRRFLADRSGVAAVEFALTLPLLVVLWLGMAELTQISMASAKATQAAQSVADLVGRYTANGFADPQGFADLEAAAATIVAPLPTAAGNPGVSIVSATLNANGGLAQAWQCTSGILPTNFNPAALLAAAPTPQNSALGSVIIVTVSYVYQPTIDGGIIGPQNFVATAYSTPRTVLAIPKPC